MHALRGLLYVWHDVLTDMGCMMEARACLLILDEVRLGQGLDGADIAGDPVMRQGHTPKAACTQDGALDEVRDAASIILVLWAVGLRLGGWACLDEYW